MSTLCCSGGAVAGIVIAAVVLFLLVVAVVILLVYRHETSGFWEPTQARSSTDNPVEYAVSARDDPNVHVLHFDQPVAETRFGPTAVRLMVIV